MFTIQYMFAKDRIALMLVCTSGIEKLKEYTEINQVREVNRILFYIEYVQVHLLPAKRTYPPLPKSTSFACGVAMNFEVGSRLSLFDDTLKN